MELNDPASQSPAGTPDWLQPLDHTADAGIVVTATDWKELFARAAWGLFAVITDPDKIRPERKERVEVQADDLAALMVKWLSELNFLHVTRHEVFGRFEILELNDTRMVAQVHGEPIDADRHTIYTEIKAVTYHGLKLEELDEGWRAEIIFDL